MLEFRSDLAEAKNEITKLVHEKKELEGELLRCKFFGYNIWRNPSASTHDLPLFPILTSKSQGESRKRTI